MESLRSTREYRRMPISLALELLSAFACICGTLNAMFLDVLQVNFPI
jgi:hypothetical protein